MVLIVGGTGTLGRIVTRLVLATGRRARVMTRVPDRATALAAAGATLVQGDLRDPASLARACAGVDVVVTAAHAILGRGAGASQYVDGEGHRQLFQAARTAGVRHVVHVSVYAGHPAFLQVPFFRIKAEVERSLQDGGVPFTILRPTAFMDFHAHVLIGAPVLAGRRVVMLGRGDRPRNFVAAEDVARLVAHIIEGQGFVNEIVEIGGPENLTPMDVVRLYERIAGRRAHVAHVPPAIVRGASTMLRPFHPGVSQMLQTAALTDALGQPFDPAPLLARVPMRLTALADWVARQAITTAT